MKNKIFFILLCVAVFSVCLTPLSAEENREIEPYAVLEHKGLLPEGSTLLKSRQYKNIFWTFNDSGNTPHLFAFGQDGSLVQPVSAENSTGTYHGILVRNAGNRDWEAAAADDSGNIIICDSGNNKNRRRDLAVYIVPEPDPYSAYETLPAVKIEFSYRDQKKFPPEKKNFDSEACFWNKGHLYLLTKHRYDTDTKLYRFEDLDPSRRHILKKVEKTNIGGMVTDAAISPDGRYLAVLTYYGITLFEISYGRNSKIKYFKKPVKYPFSAGQCEGVEFEDAENISVSNEKGQLFRIPLRDILKI
jgi:hypothetical protein